MKRRFTRTICIVISFILLILAADTVSATTISDLKEDLERDKSQLEDVNRQISDYGGHYG